MKVTISFDLIVSLWWVLDREQLDIVLLVTNYPSDTRGHMGRCPPIKVSRYIQPDQSESPCHPPVSRHVTHQQKGFVRFNICQSIKRKNS